MPLHQGHREEHDGLALGKHFVLTPCFIETQRGTVICPKSHSQPQADRPGTRTWACDSDALFASHHAVVSTSVISCTRIPRTQPMHLEGLGIFLQSSLIHSLVEYTKIDLQMALPSSPSMISEGMSNNHSFFFFI